MGLRLLGQTVPTLLEPKGENVFVHKLDTSNETDLESMSEL